MDKHEFQNVACRLVKRHRGQQQVRFAAFAGQLLLGFIRQFGRRRRHRLIQHRHARVQGRNETQFLNRNPTANRILEN